MDKNALWGKKTMVETVIRNLQKRNMEGIYAEDETHAIEIVKSLIKDGATVAVGGSMTLFETGIIDLLRSSSYEFLDRYEEGLSIEEIKNVFRQSFFADVYLTSTNAITLDGELYNVDGNGNRVAAMLYGPDTVIVVAGINKIVSSLSEAEKRVELYSAPVNMKRLNRATPCTATGSCQNCSSKDRACNEYVVIKRQQKVGRIKVILIGKEFGY